MKKSFILYLDQYEPIKSLSTEQKGSLLDAIFTYHLDGEPILDDIIVKTVFGFFKQTFDRDSDKYLEKCVKNKENANKRWDKKGTNACERMRSNAKHADSDSVSDNDSDNDSDSNLNFFEGSNELELSRTLFNLIRDREPDFKDPNCQKWAKHIDYMIRIDKRTPEQIKKVIKWCQSDEFWQNNILSTSKLRKQFSQLWLKMPAEQNYGGF